MKILQRVIALVQSRPGWAVFGVALAVRVGWVLTLGSSLAWPDEHDYAAIARRLAAGEGYVSSSFRAAPVLPFYLSVVFRLCGENFLVARLGQCVLSALMCVLIQRTGTRLGGATVGIISGALVALYPYQVYLPGVFYPECLVSFLLAATVYLAVVSTQDKSPVGWGVFTGITLGLTALARGTYLVFLPGLCVGWLCGVAASWPKRAALCGVMIAGCAVVIVPWAIRNHRVFGRWMPVSSGFGEMLWRANNPLATGDPWDRHLHPGNEDWRERLRQLPAAEQSAIERAYADVPARIGARAAEVGDTELAMDDVLQPMAVRYMSDHPLATSRRMGRRLVGWLSAFTETKTKNQYTTSRTEWVAALTFYPVLALGAWGAILGLRRWRELALIYVLLSSVTAVHMVLTVTTRYRLPLDPYVIVLAAVALAKWPARWAAGGFDFNGNSS